MFAEDQSRVPSLHFWSSKPSVIPDPGDLTPSSGLHRNPCARSCMHTCIHMHKIIIIIILKVVINLTLINFAYKIKLGNFNVFKAKHVLKEDFYFKN